MLCPASQRYAASLLEQRALAGDRPVVLGVETIFARDQHILDEWWRREIEEANFASASASTSIGDTTGRRFTNCWSRRAITREALYGLDCMPREDLRKIGARDRHAAAKIAEIRQRHPNAVIFVLFGESHLAPGHLPRRVARADARRKNSHCPAEHGRALLARRGRAGRQSGSRPRQRRSAVRLQRDAAGKVRELPAVSRPVEPLRRWSGFRSDDLQPDRQPGAAFSRSTATRRTTARSRSFWSTCCRKFMADRRTRCCAGCCCAKA